MHRSDFFLSVHQDMVQSAHVATWEPVMQQLNNAEKKTPQRTGQTGSVHRQFLLVWRLHKKGLKIAHATAASGMTLSIKFATQPLYGGQITLSY